MEAAKNETTANGGRRSGTEALDATQKRMGWRMGFEPTTTGHNQKTGVVTSRKHLKKKKID